MWTCIRCGETNPGDVRNCRNCSADESRPPSPPPVRLARVYSTTSPAQAELLRAALRGNGIDSVLENEGGAMYAVGLATAAVPLVIAVPEADAPRAAGLIRECLRSRTPGDAPEVAPPERLLRFPCPCGRELEVPESMRGSSLDCPWCGRPHEVAPGRDPSH